MTQLLSVDEATARILAGVSQLSVEMTLLEQTLGRVLAEDVRSDINLPPCGIAQWCEIALLDNPQELGLRLHRDITNLVQED